MPRRARDRRRASTDRLLARLDTADQSCAATIVPWSEVPPGCDVAEPVLFVLNGCTAGCATCDNARRRIWRVPPPSPVFKGTATFPPEI
jgi:hypothetical protein